MIPFLNGNDQLFLANLSRIQTNNENVQLDISSGETVRNASDAPDQITQLLQLEASLAQNTQTQTNLTNVQATANTADGVISNVLTLVNQAMSLGTEGANTSETAQTRQELAQQVQSVFQQVVSASQTQIGGRYIFGGDDDQSPSFQLDPSQGNGVDRLSWASNTSQVEDPNGGLFAAGLSAGQIFDPRNADYSYASGNLFAGLTSLYNALNNNDSNGITAALSSLQTASTYVNAQEGFYGALEDRLTEAQSVATSMGTALTQQISNIRDTNVAQAAVQLTEGQTDLQAALAAQAKVPPTSLFSYLA
jgi:flagellar hook-associated protein 3 FlgL